jgi:hypothetical protein
MLATLGKGLGCVLIKSTLGYWGNPGGGDARDNGEQWGTKGQFTSNLGLKRTTRITAGGRQVSKRAGFSRGSAMNKLYIRPHSCAYECCVIS